MEALLPLKLNVRRVLPTLPVNKHGREDSLVYHRFMSERLRFTDLRY